MWLLKLSSGIQTGFEIGQILLDDHQKFLIQETYFHPLDDFFIFNFFKINLIVEKVQNTGIFGKVHVVEIRIFGRNSSHTTFFSNIFE